METFEEFNAAWTRELLDHPLEVVDGFVEVSDRPGLGIDLDWDRLDAHPYEPQHWLPLFGDGWERREPRTPSA
jgi:galactonate dehydratase